MGALRSESRAVWHQFTTSLVGRIPVHDQRECIRRGRVDDLASGVEVLGVVAVAGEALFQLRSHGGQQRLVGLGDLEDRLVAEWDGSGGGCGNGGVHQNLQRKVTLMPVWRLAETFRPGMT